MIVAVTGSRLWPVRYRQTVEEMLDSHAREATMLLVGDAVGVDAYAAAWARARELTVRCFRADWRRLGRAAGPVRNAALLDCGPAKLLAFAWMAGPGTLDCVTQAKARGIPGIWLAARPVDLDPPILPFDRVNHPRRP